MATDHGSPGMLNRIEVMAPPKSAPVDGEQDDRRGGAAGVCAMPKVSGSRIATPFAPPRPGSTPMITPRITPVNISATLVGVSATPKPCISAWISSMRQFSPSHDSTGPLGSGTLNQISKIT